MKKTILIGCLLCTVLSAAAQTTDTGRLDSLQRSVDTLALRVQDLVSRTAELFAATEDNRIRGTELEKQLRQDRLWDGRSRYLNIGYVWQKLSPSEGDLRAESNYEVSLSWGKTYYLHRKPLLGMLKIGLDWSWLDVGYANYSIVRTGGTSPGGSGYGPRFNAGAHQADIGMSMGPSVTVNPVESLKAAVYARFTPSCSLVILEDETYADFVGFFNVGASVAWNAFSIGLEGRWGKAKYGGASLAGEDDSEWGPELQGSPRRLKTSSLRLYFGFRF